MRYGVIFRCAASRGLHDGTFFGCGGTEDFVSEQPGVSSEKVNPDDSRLGRAGAPADVPLRRLTSMPSGCHH